MTAGSSSAERIIKSKARYAEVCAAPGAGKTHTLLRKVERMCRDGIPADQILVVSFSNAAVLELSCRLSALQRRDSARDGDRQLSRPKLDLSKIAIKTLHGFARQLIGKKALLTEADTCALLRKVIGSVQRDCEEMVLWSADDVSESIRERRLTQLEKLLEQAETLKVLSLFATVCASQRPLSEIVAWAQFESLRAFLRVLSVVRSRFIAAKKKSGVIDYGDMLVQAISAIGRGEPVPFRHILVDEYQDCSPAQVCLLARLAKLKRRTLMVFGDSGQAIFGFGGASYTPLSAVLDGVKQFTLPNSRRLTAQNAAFASTIALHSADAVIRGDRDGKRPVLVRDESLDSQTRRVVADIRTLIKRGVAPEQIAVLARTGALLLPVEQMLLAAHVPTTRLGKVRDSLHALRVLKLVSVASKCNGKRSSAILTVLRTALGELEDVEDDAWSKAALSLRNVCRVPSLEGRYRLCAKIYLRLMGGVRDDPQLAADVNRWEPLCRAYRSAKSMRTDIRTISGSSVVTGTIHSAKGREWDHVLVVGVTDGLLPLYLARDDRALAEERNLLYVAVTRARETLRMYHAPTNHARSRQRFECVSRYLDSNARRLLLAA